MTHPGRLLAGMTTGLLQEAVSNHSFLGVVASVASGRVFVVPVGQTAPLRTSFESLVDPSTLMPGDRVSVLQHGANYVVMGKLSTSAAPPPPVPVPATATGLYLGVHTNPDPAAPGGSLTQTEFFETRSGRHQALVGLFRDWAGLGAIAPSVLTAIDAHGSVPFITWAPLDVQSDDQSAYSLANILAGNFDGYLNDQAAVLAAYNKPVFLRFASGMNTAAVPYSGDPPLFAQAWQHVHDLVAPLAPKLLWVWSVRVWGAGDPTVSDPTPYYPGDARVDWIGLEGHNSVPQNGAWQTFSEVFGFSYGQLVSSFLRPLLVAEYGCDEDPRKPDWFASALGTEVPHFFPQLGAALYLNIDQRGTAGLGADWPIESSLDATAGFRDGAASAYYLDSVA